MFCRLALGLSVTQILMGVWMPKNVSAQSISRSIAQEPPEEILPPAEVLPSVEVLPSAETVIAPAPADQSAKALAARQLADLLPAETPMALFFSADEADWEALQQFELFAKFAGFADEFMAGLAEGDSGLQAPLTTPEGTERWQGNQFVVAALPDRSPRSIAVTDIDREIILIMPVVNEAALSPYKTSLETSRSEAPEKSTYLDAELWVWPTEERSYDYGYERDLPEVPHEDWPAENLPATGPLIDSSKAQPPALNLNKAADAGVPTGLPSPGDFEPEPNYDTYTVEGKAIAFIDGYVLQATEPETLKKLLNYRQFDYARLSENPLFTRSEYGQEEGAIARLYADLSEISKYNVDGSEFTPPSGAPFPGIPDIPGLPGGLPGLPSVPSSLMRQETQAQIISALKGITIEGIIYPQAEGIRLQGRFYGNNLLRSNPTPELDYADSALEFVPAATYSFNSGRDIAGIWRQLARSLSLNETTRDYLQQGRDFVKTATGLDLDDELIGWMDREFVLFFFPSNEGALNSFSPGLGVEIGIALQTSDRPTAQNTLDTIDGLLSFFAQPTTINGNPAVSWQAPTFGVTNPDAPPFTSYVSHSWISEDTLVITSGAGAMAQLLNPVGFAPISEHPTFLNATDTLAKPNNGYGYFNAGSSFSLIYSLITDWLEVPADDPFFQSVKSYLGTIRGAGSTTSSTAEYWQLDSLLNLAPAERPAEGTDMTTGE